MANKMLIDASHPEETRVVVVRGQKVEEFDFESANRKQLRGNIYLAKVTRVEPSLQAAFVEYGGNRHGFLAFSEIHPDYYQIPVADRQALLEEDARAEREQEREEERRRGRRRSGAAKAAKTSDTVSGELNGDVEAGVDLDGSKDVEHAAPSEGSAEPKGDVGDHSDANGDDEASANGEAIIEQVGGGDALEEVPERPRHARRQYKIQEVIKRRQILLVQVVKEERGNKGAALTTYLSLAGRYSVLMPNTGRGGGISRKITNAQDRKRLKEIAQDLEVPEGMGIILRTAGASRTKAEIKRDFEYLMRMWESVRELTLSSTAPALVYEEGSLIKRAIRDLYNKDIDEVLVSGDEGYREAKDFMRMLMPSHAKVVKPYKEPQPLFAKYAVENQLDAMFSNQVTLKSGGYLVINPTEALVSIDVNSGRATREHNIEDTALKTNLEAAEEIARQLRLRDLAGLIVIDFIDMEEKRNNRAVEKKLNECLKNDRARIQVGRISPFGLLEMSRQRIRTGVLESSSVPCPHCAGTGSVRATPSVALQILRSVEETLIRSATHNLVVRTRTEVAFYILNQKRIHLRELEQRFGVSITIAADETLTGSATFAIDRADPALRVEQKAAATGIQIDDVTPVDEPTEAEPTVEMSAEENGNGLHGDAGGRRRRRRRRRGRGRGEREGFPNGAAFAGSENGEADEQDDEEDASAPNGEVEDVSSPLQEAADGAESEDDRGGRRRRRGRRGGKVRQREDGNESEALETVDSGAEEPLPLEASVGHEPSASNNNDLPAPSQDIVAESETGTRAADDQQEASTPSAPTPAPEPEPMAVVLTPPDPNRPKRAGWWSKAKSVLSGS